MGKGKGNGKDGGKGYTKGKDKAGNGKTAASSVVSREESNGGRDQGERWNAVELDTIRGMSVVKMEDNFKSQEDGGVRGEYRDHCISTRLVQ